MDFNPRGSQGYRSNQRAPPSSAKTRQPVEQDFFSILLIDATEIATFITDFGIPFSAEGINNPQSPMIIRVIERMLESLTGLNVESLNPVLDIVSEEFEYGEAMMDTMRMMACFRSLRQLLNTCGMRDLQLGDLLSPTRQRTIKMFSLLINFIRFKTEHQRTIDEHSNKFESIKQTVDNLEIERDELQHKLETLEIQRKQEEPLVRKLQEERQQARILLSELKREQEGMTNEFQEAKNERKVLKDQLIQASETKLRLKQDCERLRPYIVDEPGRLQTLNNEMAMQLQMEKNRLMQVERRARALQTTTDSFGVIETDVNACIKVMEECESELLREEEDSRKASRHKDVLRKRQLEYQDMEKREEVLKTRLSGAQEKVRSGKGQAEKKSAAARARMAELRGVYDQLASERREKSHDMDKLKMQIDLKEKQCQDAKEFVENESRETLNEWQKLTSHVLFYMKEMGQQMDLISVT
ncbi:kinetochore-associated Ndc80 complex subunit nuf2 [Orbilia ellipsospora]|uniref:Probable kinetochore protein NUF2 n=1 Tax=Orbilia ellipsospora TaxID=2528407 RepID=A0AAV9XUI4_9PEZI